MEYSKKKYLKNTVINQIKSGLGCYNKSRFLKLASFNGKESLDNVIIQLL